MAIWGHIEVARVPGIGGGHHNEARVIVKASTIKRARELLGQSFVCAEPTPRRFRDYWSETGNVVEHEVAVNDAEGVWYAPSRSGVHLAGDYKRDPGRG